MVDGSDSAVRSRKKRTKEAGSTSGSCQLEGPLGSTPSRGKENATHGASLVDCWFFPACAEADLAS